MSRFLCIVHERGGDTPNPCEGKGGILLPCEVLRRFACVDHVEYGRLRKGCGFFCYAEASFQGGACPQCNGDEYGGLVQEDFP